MIKQLDCNGRILDLRTPQVMGILNVTPDSFSDGGQHNNYDDALRHAEPAYWAADGVHPTLAGHGLMAKTWLDIVKP